MSDDISDCPNIQLKQSVFKNWRLLTGYVFLLPIYLSLSFWNKAKFIVVAILLLCYFTILVFSFVIYFFKFMLLEMIYACV